MKLFCRKCREHYFTKETNMNVRHRCGEYGFPDWQHEGGEEGATGGQ